MLLPSKQSGLSEQESAFSQLAVHYLIHVEGEQLSYYKLISANKKIS